MKEKLIKYFKNYYIISFCLGALAYYMFLSYSQMAGGKYIVLTGDALEGYIPGLKHFFDSLQNGKGITYSWSSYLGMNSFVGIPGMLIFSVSTPFYLLLNNVMDYAYITVIVLVFKAGLASMCFYIFACRTLKIKKINSIVFGVFYAMCGFQVSYIPVLLHFSDAIFMLPLILFLVSEFSEKGKFRLMIVGYIYLFLNFYYTGYIVGFFSFFYLLLYMTIKSRYSFQTIIKKLLLFGMSVLIAAGVIAILLYPTAYFFMTKYAEDASQLSDFGNVFLHDLYNQLFIGQNAGIRSRYPYLYCGIPVMLLLPFYLFNKKIVKNEKIIILSLLTLMVLSCFVPILYLFWHCFDAPDGFAYRFSFIISFILCIMAARQSEFIKELNKRNLIVVMVFSIIIYVACIYIQPLLQNEFLIYPENTWFYLIINIGFMMAYYLWVLTNIKLGAGEKNNHILVVILIFILMSEVIFNGCSIFLKASLYNPLNNFDSYKLWQKTMNEAVEKIEEDGAGFYRVGSEGDFILNDATYYDYNGIVSFSNLENYEVRKALQNLGIATSPRVIFSMGLTDFTKMIFDVEYNIKNIDFGEHQNYVTDFEQHAIINKNEYCLSIGFMVDKDIEHFKFAGNNQFDNINNLAGVMVGRKSELYDIFSGELEYLQAGISIAHDEDGRIRYYLNSGSTEIAGALLISIPNIGKAAYIQFDYGDSTLDNHIPYFYNPFNGEHSENDRISLQYIVPMICNQDAYYIGILMENGVYNNIFAPNNIYCAYYNYDEFLKVYDALKDGQMEVLDYGNGWVDGHIDVNEDGKVLFTSIPYDEGWEIKVNGVKTEPLQLLDGAFIGLELPKGSYDIEFRYHVPGFKMGLIITLISMAMLILLFIINPRIKTIVRPEKAKKEKEEIEVKETVGGNDENDLGEDK